MTTNRMRTTIHGLAALHMDIEDDESYRSLRGPGVRLIGGIGSLRPEAMVVCAAPGAAENTAGAALRGPAGALLSQLMELAGLRVLPGQEHNRGQYANAWVTYACKYRSPGQAKPSVGIEIASRPHLWHEWLILGKPRLIITVGATAWNCMGPIHMGGVTQNAGRVHLGRDDRTYLYPTYDPLMGTIPNERQQQIRDKLERDWSFLREELGRHGYEPR